MGGCCCKKKPPPGPTPEELAAQEEKRKERRLKKEQKFKEAQEAKLAQQQKVAAQLAALLGGRGAIQASQIQTTTNPVERQRSSSVLLSVENMQRKLQGLPPLTELPGDHHPFGPVVPAAPRKSSVILAAENAGK